MKPKFYNPFKVKKVKINPVHFRLDSDRDKVFDFKDCRPFNPKKQDEDLEDLHFSLVKQSIREYGGELAMERAITQVVKAYMSNKELPRFSKCSWYNKQKRILEISDDFAGVDHYIYYSKRQELVGLLSIPDTTWYGIGVQPTDAERNAMINWAYKQVISYLNKHKSR